MGNQQGKPLPPDIQDRVNTLANRIKDVNLVIINKGKKILKAS